MVERPGLPPNCSPGRRSLVSHSNERSSVMIVERTLAIVSMRAMGLYELGIS